MSFLDDAIREGVESGMAEGTASVFWRDHGWLTTSAFEVLDRPILRGGTPKQQGARKALIEAGLIEVSWFGMVSRVTAEGKQAVAEDRAVRAQIANARRGRAA